MNIDIDMSYYFQALRKYAVFEGRSSRKEYWIFLLVDIIIIFLLAFIDTYFDLNDFVSNIYFWLTFIPAVAVNVRRLHDVNKTGWWALVPIVGTLIYTAEKSYERENRYVPKPLA